MDKHLITVTSPKDTDNNTDTKKLTKISSGNGIWEIVSEICDLTHILFSSGRNLCIFAQL